LENQLNISTLEGVVSSENVEWRKVFDDIHRLFSEGGDIFKNACSEGNLSVVEIMLSNSKFDEIINFADKPIKGAIRGRFVKVVRRLLEDGRFDPNTGYCTYSPLSEACDVSSFEIVKMLLEDKRVNMSTRHNLFALYSVGRQKDIEIVKLFLSDNRVDPNTGGCLIIEASAEGNIEIVKLLLLDPRIDPSIRDDEAMKLAMENEHFEVAELLKADNRVNPNATSEYTVERLQRKTMNFLTRVFS